MQAGGRRGHRPLLAREHGLVVGRVALIDGALAGDVGRQRRVAHLGDRLVERGTMKGEGERHLAGLALRFDGGVELSEEAHAPLAAEADDVALAEPLCRLHQRLPARPVDALDQRRLDFRLGVAAEPAPGQLGRDDLRVVDDELIAGAQELRQIAHAAIFERPARPDDEHARGIARRYAGRSAIRSGGRSKSKRSVRMRCAQCVLILRRREAPARRM